MQNWKLVAGLILLATQLAFTQVEQVISYYNGNPNIEAKFNIPFLQKLATRFDITGECQLQKIEYYVESLDEGNTFNLYLYDINEKMPSVEFFGPLSVTASQTGWNEIVLSDKNIILDCDIAVSFEIESTFFVSFGCEFNEPITDRLFFHDCCGWQPYNDRDVLIKITVSDVVSGINKSRQPETLSLLSAYPNPFNAGTKIRAELLKPQNISVYIYDITGKKIKTLLVENYINQSFELNWNGTNDLGNSCASGIYFVTVIGDQFSKTQKLSLLK